MKRRIGSASLALGAATLLAGSSGALPAQEAGADDGFAELQRRGEMVMGVDQHTSSHLFEPLPDGGRIVLVREVDDPEGTDRIRRHLEENAAAFAAGDFRSPDVVHEREVPGTAVMRRKAAVIAYAVRELPRGGELRISTADPEAVAAIHEFLAFQRRDHRTGDAPR